MELNLSPNGDTLHFPPREASLAPGQVTGIQLRVWGMGADSLGLRLDVQGKTAELSLPIQWREAARLELTVKTRDRAGFLPARVYVVGSDRLARGPAGTFLRSTWTGGHQYFHTRGASSLVLPSGPARILVVHGFEHAPVTMDVDLEPEGNRVEVHPSAGNRLRISRMVFGRHPHPPQPGPQDAGPTGLDPRRTAAGRGRRPGRFQPAGVQLAGLHHLRSQPLHRVAPSVLDGGPDSVLE